MWITGAMIVLLKIASTSKPIFGETQCTVVFVVYFENFNCEKCTYYLNPLATEKRNRFCRNSF